MRAGVVSLFSAQTAVMSHVVLREDLTNVGLHMQLYLMPHLPKLCMRIAHCLQTSTLIHPLQLEEAMDE